MADTATHQRRAAVKSAVTWEGSDRQKALVARLAEMQHKIKAMRQANLEQARSLLAEEQATPEPHPRVLEFLASTIAELETLLEES